MKMIRLLTFMVFALLSATTFAQSNNFSTYYNQRRTLFEHLPVTPNAIIFVGNSITDGGEWAELLGNSRAKNRGISGDTTEGVLYRLDNITKGKPAKVFLMIGINDLAAGVKKEQVFDNICMIAKKIRDASSKTTVYIESLLPVNDHFHKFPNHVDKEKDVEWIDHQLKDWCHDNGFNYIDLFSHFALANEDRLNPSYTNDGLHLTGAGYMEWSRLIRPYVDAQ